MTAEHFTAGKYIRQNETEERNKGNFCSPGRLTVHEGTTPQTNSRAVEAVQLDLAPKGNIHRNTVDRLVPPPEGHRFPSMHRPEPVAQPPSGPFDLADLKSHQEAMLTPRAKRARKQGKRSKGH